MNRSGAAAGVMQSSPVQQMMMATGNPTSWWNLNYSHPLKPPAPAPPAAVSSACPSHNFSSSSGYSPDLLVPTSVVPNMNNCNLNLLFQHQNYSSSSSSTSSSSSSPTASSNWSHLDPPPTQQQQQLPAAVDSWNQFLANGTTTGQLLSGCTNNHHHHDKATGGLINQQFEESNYSTNYRKMENIPVLMQQQQQAVKQDNIINPISNYHGGGGGGYHNFYRMMSTNNNTTAQLENNQLMMNVIKSNHQNWPSCSLPFAPNSTSTAVASPQSSSCVTTNFTGCSNLVDFPHPTTQMAANTSPECKNISAAANTGGSGGGAVLKKAKVQQPTSSSPSTFKVRKFGDRITALHQMVSPFGKTDTASVLLEAIGYIRFLHSQIEALSIPYLSNGNGSANNTRQLHPHTVQGDQKNCLFPEDPGQISNDNCLKRKAACHEQEEPRKDLRRTGLCLVPLSCTALHMGNENGADYWAPSLGGFR